MNRDCKMNCVKVKKVTLNFDINGRQTIKFRGDQGEGFGSI